MALKIKIVTLKIDKVALNIKIVALKIKIVVLNIHIVVLKVKTGGEKAIVVRHFDLQMLTTLKSCFTKHLLLYTIVKFSFL